MPVCAPASGACPRRIPACAHRRQERDGEVTVGEKGVVVGVVGHDQAPQQRHEREQRRRQRAGLQARAQAVYLVRSPRLDDLADVQQRVIDCARGAAIMTGTTVEVEFVKACSGVLPNTTIEEALVASMHAIGAPQYDAQELALAQSLHDSLESPERTLSKISRLCDSETRESVLAHQGEPIYAFIAPHTPTDAPIVTISTDAGDASRCAPMSQMSAAAWAADTPAHSWQAVAIGKSSIAHKAMLFAGKSLALTAARLAGEPELLSRARREFDARSRTQPYVCPIPADVKPSF